MKHLPWVAALLAAVAAGPASGDSPYDSWRNYRRDPGPSYSDRHRQGRHHDDDPRGSSRHEERRPRGYEDWRAPRPTPNPVFIAPQRKAIP